MLTLLFLIAVKLLHEGVLVVPWLKNAIADHSVNWITKERKVSFGTQRFFDHHTFRVHDEPIRADIWIAQYLAQRFDSFAKPLKPIHDLSGGKNGFEERACKTQRATLQIHEAAGVPLEGIWHTQQAYRFASWGCIDDYHLEVALTCIAIDVDETNNLIHTWDERELLGHNRVHPLFAQHLAHRFLHLTPPPAHLI